MYEYLHLDPKTLREAFMAEYKCETCHITMDADEDDKDCPVCSNEMHPVYRKKECSMRPSEQLRGIGAS